MLGGSKLKRIFQQHFPPGLQGKLKGLYNALGRYRVYFIRQKITPPFPTYLQIEPTVRCNISCIMCQRQRQIKDMAKAPDMTLAQFKIILSCFPSPNYINLQGNGEPFLNKDIIDMIAEAKHKDKYVLTATNATLLNNELNQKILDSGLDKLIISFIGLDKTVYEGIMRGADFQKVKDNIRLLTELKKKKSLSHPKIILTAGFLKSNINNLIKLPDLSKELGTDGIEIGPFYGVDSDTPALSEIEKALNDIEKRAAGKKVSLYLNRNDFKRKYRAQECLWPWQGIYITVKGDITPCCSRAYYADKGFGNIYEQNFESIWHGAEYIDFRKGLTGRGPLPVICRGCPWDR